MVHLSIKTQLSHDMKFSYISTKTYVVGTQKHRLNETVLLSTQNIMGKIYAKNYG